MRGYCSDRMDSSALSFCEECGAPRDGDGRLCVSCAAKAPDAAPEPATANVIAHGPVAVQRTRPDWMLLIALACIAAGIVALGMQRDERKERARTRPRSFLVEQTQPVKIPMRMPVAEAAPPEKSPDPEVVQLEPMMSVGETLPGSPEDVLAAQEQMRPESERKSLYRKIVGIRYAARTKAIHDATKPVRDWPLGTAVTIKKPIMFPNDPEIDGKAGYSPIFEGTKVTLHKRRPAAVGVDCQVSIAGSTPRWIDGWIVQMGVIGIGTGVKVPDYAALVTQNEMEKLAPFQEKEEMTDEELEALFEEGYREGWPTGLKNALPPNTLEGSFCVPCLK